jgi:hypothetical protein
VHLGEFIGVLPCEMEWGDLRCGFSKSRCQGRGVVREGHKVAPKGNP